MNYNLYFIETKKNIPFNVFLINKIVQYQFTNIKMGISIFFLGLNQIKNELNFLNIDIDIKKNLYEFN